MAAAAGVPANADTLITIKVAIDGTNRRFKLPLRDLSAKVFPDKLRNILAIPENQEVLFERFSDSLASYVVLSADNHGAYKQLYRAAKAKLKLRIKATLIEPHVQAAPEVPAEAVVPSALSSQEPVQAAAEPAVASSPSCTTIGITPSACEAPFMKHSQIPIRSGPCSTRRMNHDAWKAELYQISMAKEKERRQSKDSYRPASGPTWLVYCNNCDTAMPDAHYHCSICDGGDYDLCEACVNAGVLCPGQTHWLIKRFVQNGQVVNSITEKIPPKPKPEADRTPELPGTFKEDVKPEPIEPVRIRTCNSCVKVFPELNLVNCKDCSDFDLCISCHTKNEHGHNPRHSFQPVLSASIMSFKATSLLAPGRNVRHLAICDGCEKTIHGVRHKCLDCPDWDFCAGCFTTARTSHTGHRFIPIYEPLAMCYARGTRHGVYCDGPLCLGKSNGQRYIEGIRYKCAVCHDTDFCAACEAHPSNKHNPTHPLIMFKTPVKNVSVTTMGEDKNGTSLATMGDKFPWTNPTMTNGTQAATTQPNQQQAEARQRQQLETINRELFQLHAKENPQYLQESKRHGTPTLPTQQEWSHRPTLPNTFRCGGHMKSTYTGSPVLKQSEIGESNYQVKSLQRKPTPKLNLTPQLNAQFLSDAVPDGSKFIPGARFQQTWVLRNPGPIPWPVGCGVCYIGGDANLSVQSESVTNITQFPVENGQEYHFSITMIAPEREGKHISYWRLKAPDGTPFGHRLWCDINVAASNGRSKLEENLIRNLKDELAETMKQVKLDALKSEEDNEDLSSSEMVFPTLEKESPSSSTYQDAPATIPAVAAEGKAATDENKAANSTTIGLPSETIFGDAVETVEHSETASDLDSMTVADELDDDSDEGFLTDEEYDILDASDEEIINSGK